MKRKVSVIVFIILIITLINSNADTTHKLSGESVSFKSVSKSASFELEGVLTKPTGEGPYPAIVMLHGAGGIKGVEKRYDAWIKRFSDWGYVSLLVDSFGPRGVSSIAAKPSTIAPNTRAQDAYDAKFYLNGLSFVNQNQIAIMGWSHGGWSLFRAADDLLHIKNRGKLFRLAIAFYPYCDFSLEDLNTPTLILTGELDDWCPAKLCQSRMPTGKSKHEIVLKIYPEAHHCFDWEGVDEIKVGHRLLYNSTAAVDSIKQVKNFLHKYLK